MDILCIGNSFSQDATRYLHQVARADKTALTAVNLYIGGCSLSRHYRNMLSGKAEYTMEINGYSSGFAVSLSAMLTNRDWDVVTLQQVSSLSNDYSTYQPYLSKLAAYVREYVPKAKLCIHQTWAYEDGSARLCEEMGYRARGEMFADIKKSYLAAAKEINADGIIPSGQVFENLVAGGVTKIHRDTYHATHGIGRYALALIWYKALTGNSVLSNSFCDFDEEISPEDIKAVKACAEQTEIPVILP